MYIIHQSRDLLVVHSPATMSRIIFAIMLAIGAMLCAAAGICLVLYLLDILGGATTSGYLGGAAGFGFFGVILVVGGCFGFRSAHDRDFIFDNQVACLIVRWRTGERTIPFARIQCAEVFDDGVDTVAYALRLRLYDPREDLKLNDRLHRDTVALQALADKINRFLNVVEKRPMVSTVGDVITKTRELISDLWYGPPSEPPVPVEPVVRDSPVLFACPACAWQTDEPVGPPPYTCEQCQVSGKEVFLQDRTPGRTLVVDCACGNSFAVPKSFAGTHRPCPACRRKCRVPERY
jgi:hypothetical protein